MTISSITTASAPARRHSRPLREACPIAPTMLAPVVELPPSATSLLRSDGVAYRHEAFFQRAVRSLRDETGAATAEYAITVMAAVAFAGLLVVIMQSPEVRGLLEDLVRRALTYHG